MKKRTYKGGTARETQPGKWELRYTPPGSVRISKTVKAESQLDAEDQLAAWRKDLNKQANPGVKVPCSLLFERKLADMRRMNRSGKNIGDQEKKIAKHLIPFFGHREASTITLRDINKYIDKRLAEGRDNANATINRELSNLRHAFRVGVDELYITSPLPKYKKLPEDDNIRQGFIEPAVYRKVMSFLPPHLHMLWCFGFYFGIRRGELLQLRWEWLIPYLKDPEPIIKIPGKITKTKKPHTIPLYHPEMRGMVELALASRDPKCPYLFQRNGERVSEPKEAINAAREAAGVPEVLFHDLRRTGVRNMILGGIPEKRAMQISGHKTRSIFDRYDITNELDAIDTGRQMRKYWERRAEQEAAHEQVKLGDKLGDDISAEPLGRIN